MKILIINCGSSSIKYKLLDMQSAKQYSTLAKGILERIGMAMGKMKHTPDGKDAVITECPIPDHTVGMKMVLDALVSKEHGVIESFADIDAVGHRVVQGADFFDKSALVDEDVMKKIEICCDFAPLHNPAHILGIRAVQAVLPSVPQVVTFDTAFHQTMEPKAYMYALPYEYYEKYKVRRYGAHGTSHMYVSRKGAEFAGLDINNSRIITCHIGSGSSIAAIKNGKCVDTTMGFTPLEGMIMGTRCGCIDANIVPFIMKKEGLTPDEMTDIMNKKSGFIGMSKGLTSDMRDMADYASQGNEIAQLVIDKLKHDITKIIGGYIAELGGVDLVIFTAGIAENNPWFRKEIMENFSYLGIKVDDQKNNTRSDETVFTTPDSPFMAAMIPTDEELMIAIDTMDIVSAL